MRRYSAVIPANDRWTFSVKGNYVFLRTSLVAVQVLANENGEQAELSQGDSAEFSPFTEITIANPTGSALTVVIMVATDKRVQSAQVGGAITITSIVAVMATGANTQKTVTTTSAQLVAANASRKYLLVQNKDVVGSIWLNFGATATQANGYRLGPGDEMRIDCNQLTAAINAIGDISSNANIVVVEG